jgi:hypothetical protein
MSKKWFSGPPPSVGWWPASWAKNAGILRWWNGVSWSCAAEKGDLIEQVKSAASTYTEFTNDVQWQHRPSNWPKRSRT